MTRQEANREILKILSEAVERWPDQRFVQLLDNIGVLERWTEPSTGVLLSYQNTYNKESVSILDDVRKQAVFHCLTSDTN